MDKKMKLSIIIANYNQNMTIVNLLSQIDSWNPDAEVIIVDDGSKGEWNIDDYKIDVKYYRQRDKGFRLWKAFNAGAKLAEGEYLMFLDGDTIAKDNFIEKIIPYLNPNRVISLTRHAITDDGKIIPDDRKKRITEENFYEHATGGTLIILKKLFNLCGGFDENYQYGLADFDLAYKAMKQGAEGYLSKVEIYHLEHEKYEYIKIRPEDRERFKNLTSKE